VLRHLDPLIEHLTVDGEELDATPEHPFFTEDDGWVTAGEMRTGEHVREAHGGEGALIDHHRPRPRSAKWEAAAG
jgi:hypothetical protein